MMVSKDLLILQALTDHLAGITPANGYDLDLTGVVFRGRTRFGDNDPLPMLSILEAPRTEDPLFFVGDLNQRRVERWTLLVQGWAADDHANPSDPVYALKAACEDRLSQLTAVDPRTGNGLFPTVYLLLRKLVNVQIGPGIVSPPREGISNRAFFYLPLALDRMYNPADVLTPL